MGQAFYAFSDIILLPANITTYNNVMSIKVWLKYLNKITFEHEQRSHRHSVADAGLTFIQLIIYTRRTEE